MTLVKSLLFNLIYPIELIGRRMQNKYDKYVLWDSSSHDFVRDGKKDMREADVMMQTTSGVQGESGEQKT